MNADTAYHGKKGEHFAVASADHVYNAHTDRPAMLRLAGDVTGLSVLDLGCGAGHYAVELAERGAGRIVGVDGSESMLGIARERLGDRAELHLHDLEEPLDFLPDASFDLALMALVYHHVDAREQLLAGIRRALRPGGALLVSTTHPTADWQYFEGSYHAHDRVEFPIGDGHTITYWRMSLEQFIGELLGAGFVLEELAEPRSTEAGRQVDARRYEKTHNRPTFLAVRLRRP
ncbi:methyltransferase domain-containing protein [Streptomyces sp. SID8379]|uniref:class I SAM-dependent methyltransferase n=1 Tax=unclassified Streptomyces TaxID=2593676 RepID=UPI00037A161C|nr:MULTISPECIES: class I SAM-dependent methyltransferase [unclassified Streptomyces]MYW66942.1 methyltransferase domain-containing protein [Streptomyces sp. SID8379]